MINLEGLRKKASNQQLVESPTVASDSEVF